MVVIVVIFIIVCCFWIACQLFELVLHIVALLLSTILHHFQIFGPLIALGLLWYFIGTPAFIGLLICLTVGFIALLNRASESNDAP